MASIRNKYIQSQIGRSKKGHGFSYKNLYTTTSNIILTTTQNMMKIRCSLHDQRSSHRYILMSCTHVWRVHILYFTCFTWTAEYTNSLWMEQCKSWRIIEVSIVTCKFKLVVLDLRSRGGLDYDRIHACVNDCILFCGTHKEARHCPTLIGLKTLGKHACPICGPSLVHEYANDLSKTIFDNHHRFLPSDHPKYVASSKWHEQVHLHCFQSSFV